MLGQGKYDLVCEHVRKVTNAKGVIIMIFDGDNGPGMSAQLPAGLEASVPTILRRLALLMEQEKEQQAALAAGN